MFVGSRATCAVALLAVTASCVTQDVARDKPESERALEELFQTGERPDVSAGPTSRWDDLREEFDADSDGALWPHELPNRDFERFDRNRDGVVTLQDYPVESGEIDEWIHFRLEGRAAKSVLRKALGIGDAARSESWQERFFAIDKDGNRGIDRAEFRATLGPEEVGRRDGISALLDLADADQDDLLGWLELDALLGEASDDSR